MHLDRHLLKLHGTKPHSPEQSVLCKLGRDRTLLEGLECPCPIPGCRAVVRHLNHHMRNVHSGLSKAEVDTVLRPLRWEVAMCELHNLRAAEPPALPLVTELDLRFFEGKEAEEPPPPPPIKDHKCRRSQCELIKQKKDKLNRKLHKQLYIAHKVSRDLWYNEALTVKVVCFDCKSSIL